MSGVDAVVAEGFEAGGHNGREETTTLCLVPDVVNAINIPLIAAGGIVDGKSMLSAMILGADGVQMGTRFVACKESSAHDSFKNMVLNNVLFPKYNFLNSKVISGLLQTLSDIPKGQIIGNDKYDVWLVGLVWVADRADYVILCTKAGTQNQ